MIVSMNDVTAASVHLEVLESLIGYPKLQIS